MYIFTYNENMFYINVHNIASIKVSNRLEIEILPLSIYDDILDREAYTVYIKYTGGAVDRFRFETEKEANELALNLAEYRMLTRV